MSLKKLVILLSFVLLGSVLASAQCKNFTKKKCMPEMLPYVHNGQMNTAVLLPGDTAQLQLTFFSGQQYRLMICAQESLENVYFEVRTKGNQLLYSSKDDSKQIWDFTTANTQPLKVDVIVPPMATAPNELTHNGCVAIMVGFKE